MGNSNNNVEKYDTVMTKFKIKETTNHPQLGLIRVHNYKENEKYQIFEFSKTATSSEQAKLMSVHYKHRKSFNNPHLLQIFYVSEQHNQVFCQESSHITVIGEYFYKTLQDEMKNNYQTKNYNNSVQQFPEIRLWQIILQIVDACCFLERNGRYHGEIKPKYIYLDSDSNVKLIEHNFVQGNLSGYQKALISNDFQYLSPELLQEIKNKNSSPNVDWSKADVFSFGVCLIELASLQNCEQCYDWLSKEVNVNKLIIANDQLLIRGYSKLLTNLIYQMLANVEIRPKFTDLRIVLQNFEQEIINNVDFYSKYNDRQVQTSQVFHSVYTQPQQKSIPWNQTQSVYLQNNFH